MHAQSRGDLWYYPAAFLVLGSAQPGEPVGWPGTGGAKAPSKNICTHKYRAPCCQPLDDAPLPRTLRVPVCPFPSPGWPQGFWTSLSASHVQVLLPHQCPGEGGDGAGAGAKLVMGLRCGCESPPCPEPCHALAVSREELCASPLPTPALGAHPWALPGAPSGRTGPGSGESPCWNGVTGQKLLEKGYWGQPHVWEHRHTNL